MEIGTNLEWKLESLSDLSGCWLSYQIDEHAQVVIQTYFSYEDENYNYVVFFEHRGDTWEVPIESISEGKVVAEELMVGFLTQSLLKINDAIAVISDFMGDGAEKFEIQLKG